MFIMEKGMNHRDALPLFTERIVAYQGFRYVTIKVAPSGQWPKKHRWVMEQHLGRKLGRHEIVHHVDENTLNNELSNLRIMSMGCHSQLHSVTEKWSRNYDACTSCGTTEAKHNSHGLCITCASKLHWPLVRAKRTKWSRKYDCCINCGRSDRRHAARGLCNTCDTRTRRIPHPRVPRWARKHDCCTECKTTDSPHVGGGLCGGCYTRQYRASR